MPPSPFNGLSGIYIYALFHRKISKGIDPLTVNHKSTVNHLNLTQEEGSYDYKISSTQSDHGN